MIFLELKGNQVVTIISDISVVSDTSKGTFVQEMPQEQPPQGQQVSGIFYDNEVYYTYAPIPLTIAQKIDLIQSALNDLILGV